jgi:hypothetical protein
MKLRIGADSSRPKLPGLKAQFFFERMFSREFAWGQLKNGFFLKRGKLRLRGFFFLVLSPVKLFLFGAGHRDLGSDGETRPLFNVSRA